MGPLRSLFGNYYRYLYSKIHRTLIAVVLEGCSSDPHQSQRQISPDFYLVDVSHHQSVSHMRFQHQILSNALITPN
jgi:hypothetical protein